jgi:D-alanyl-D-alanine carboxypeptidase (penicillin-binding protein 5/6)
MFKKIYFLILLFLSSISNSYSNIEIKARTAILQDFLSGEILYEKDPDIQIYPASMTKIMTSIVAFDLIKSGNLSLDDKFIVSEKAWRLIDCWIFLNVYNGWG